MVRREKSIGCNGVLRWCWAGRIANHQFGLNHDLGYPRSVAFEAFQQGASRCFTHFFERLAHCGESWVVVHSDSNVVEAHNRNYSTCFFGATLTIFLDRPSTLVLQDYPNVRYRAEAEIAGKELNRTVLGFRDRVFQEGVWFPS